MNRRALTPAARRLAGALGTFFVLAACSPADSGLFSGTVQAPSAAVGSPIGGRVTAVLVADGQPVRAGALLVRFDDAQQRATLEGARHQAAAAAAALADARAGARPQDLARARNQAQQAREAYESARQSEARQIDVLRGQLAQAQAQLADARADAANAATDAARQRALFATGDVSAQVRDAADAREVRTGAQVADAQSGVANARTQLRNAAEVTLPRGTAAARAAYDAAQHASELLAAGSRPDVIRQAAATLAAARSTVAGDEARLRDTEVRAPADGTISATDLHVGDMVAPGAPVATVDEAGEPYVRVFLPQSLVGRVHVGQHLAVHADSQPGVPLDGTVEQIDDNAQFTPQNVESAADRATLSFGVKVRIHDRAHPVHGGTTAAVSLS